MEGSAARRNGEAVRWRDIERLERQIEDLYRVKANVGDQENLRADLGETQRLLQTVLVELATLRTKIGLWSAIGALLGGGVVSALVYLVTGPG